MRFVGMLSRVTTVMYQRTGSANLPLHVGRVPPWLSTRIAAMGRVIAEAIVHEYGRDELLSRLAHPFWFQSFGAVMGMDWQPNPSVDSGVRETYRFSRGRMSRGKHDRRTEQKRRRSRMRRVWGCQR